MIKKYLLIALVILAIAAIAFIVYVTNQKFSLEIFVIPGSASISVDGKLLGTGHITTTVVRGNHKVEATKEGYNSYSESLSVSKNISQTIALTNSSLKQGATSLSLTPHRASQVLPGGGVLVAIDNTNSNLIKIDKNGVITIYPKPVYSFSFLNPYVVLIEKGDRNKLAVINIESGDEKTFDATLYSPVVSISINNDSKNFYFLGKYNPSTRTTNLYSTSLSSFKPADLGIYAADDVKALNDSNVLLVSTSDASDLTNFSIYSLSDKKYLYTTRGSGALTSPDFKNLAVFASNSLVNISLKDIASNSFSFDASNQKIGWLDPDTLVLLTNKFPGVEYSKIDTAISSQTSNTSILGLEKVSVQFALGSSNNNFYIQTSDGRVWALTLP